VLDIQPRNVVYYLTDPFNVAVQSVEEDKEFQPGCQILPIVIVRAAVVVFL
jgi:hypothetical protein